MEEEGAKKGKEMRSVYANWGCKKRHGGGRELEKRGGPPDFVTEKPLQRGRRSSWN